MARSTLFVFSLLSLAAGCATTGTMMPAPADGPRSHAPRPTTGDITASDLATRLYIFADDSMLGRESGKLGNVKGTNYVAAEMRRMGLEPAGENGTYFQTVPVILASASDASTFAVDGAPLTLWKDIAPSVGGAAARTLHGAIPVIFGGQVGAATITPEQAAGKVVVLLSAAPAPGNAQPPFSGANTQARAQRNALAPLMRSAAAIAYVALDALSPQAAAAMRSPNEELGGPIDPRAVATAQGLYVTTAAARRMLGVQSLDGLALGTAGRSLEANLAVTRLAAPYPARNVIGIVRGSDPSLRGEYVAVGAHNDHIGLTSRPLDHDSVLANNMVIRRQGGQDSPRAPTAEEAARIAVLRDSLVRAHGGARPDSVNNGADDDGSGTVAMLEIAERFATAAQKPRRSILFVSHTGEEKGLWGSQWFTDHPTVPRDSIVAQLNMDMVGRGKATDIMGRGPNNVQLIGPRRLSTQLGNTIDSLNAVRTPHMDIDTSFDANGHPLNRYCRSDHYMYARYNIPITYFSLGYHTDYHQVTDEPQYIDYDHMQRIASFVHDIAETVANRSQRLVVDGPRMDPNGGCRQ